MFNNIKYGLSLAVVLLLPQIALAHPGHSHGLLGGLVHPFTGIDHILGMLSIGVWATARKDNNKLLFFVMYIIGLVVGGMIGIDYKLQVNIDLMIALSVGITSLFIIRHVNTMLVIQSLLTVIFSFSHGLAHGSEIPSLAHPGAYILGFILSSSILFLLGGVLGKFLSLHPNLKQNTGYFFLLSAIGLILES
jgi:urease accessory protein